MNREIKAVSKAFPTMDGDGVALQRNDLFDGRLDPFLMLDEFKASPSDALNGFPVHPHRGIQTLSYMIHGAIQHKDSLGTQSEVKAGGLQWMHTGQGILHDERPSVDENGLWGFQFWLNVPREEKYQPPQYQDTPAEQTLITQRDNICLRVLAGNWQFDGQHYQAPFQQLSGEGALADLTWQQNQSITLHSSSTTLAIFVLTGTLEVDAKRRFQPGELVQFSHGDQVTLNGILKDTRILIFKGEPIGEPIFHRGPFVMTNAEEMRETIEAFHNGTLVQHSAI